MPTTTKGFLILSMELQETVPVRIDLYTTNGEKVIEIESGTFPAGQNRVITDISLSPAGTYIVRFNAGNEAMTFKIIKN